MKSEKLKTKALVLAICVLILAAMSAICIASTTTYSVPIGTGAADLADINLASAYSWEFATGYTGAVDEWSEDIRLTTDSAGSSDHPAIAVDTNNNVHITWVDYRDGNGEIYYKHTIASVTSPTVSIYTDKTSYTAGDTMRLGLDVTNPGASLPVRFAIWLEQPGGGIYVLTYTSVTLPAGCDYSNENFAVITLPSIAAGTYTWNAAIIEPSGHIEFISHDTAEWEFVGREASIEIADITEAFPAITEIEFED